jgi:hypothetical protein
MVLTHMTRITDAGSLLNGSMLALALVLAGCSSGVVQDRVLESKPMDSLAAARGVLRNYVDGQPLGSEAIDFDSLVEQVTRVDPDKGDRLKTFFDRTRRTGRPDASQAKKLLSEF